MSWKSRLGRGLMIWISLVIRVLGTFAIAGPFLRQEEMVPSSPPNAGPLFLLIPGNSGRFLLAVVSHGAPQRRFDRTAMSPANLIKAGKWLAYQGFAVAIPDLVYANPAAD